MESRRRSKAVQVQSSGFCPYVILSSFIPYVSRTDHYTLVSRSRTSGHASRVREKLHASKTITGCYHDARSNHVTTGKCRRGPSSVRVSDALWHAGREIQSRTLHTPVMTPTRHSAVRVRTSNARRDRSSRTAGRACTKRGRVRSSDGNNERRGNDC